MNRIVFVLAGWLLSTVVLAAQLPGPFPAAIYGLHQARIGPQASADCATTSGAATFTSTSIAYVQADVGSIVICRSQAPPAQACAGVITSIVGNVATATALFGSTGSARSLTTCNTSITNGFITVGPDNAAAIQKALDACANTGYGGTVEMPLGVYIAGSALTLSGSCTLQGMGNQAVPYISAVLDYGPSSAHSVIVAGFGTNAGFLNIGDGTNLYDYGNQLQHIVIDGSSLVQVVVNNVVLHTDISFATIYGGGLATAGAALYSNAGGLHVENSYIENLHQGSCVWLDGAHDSKVRNNDLANCAKGQIYVLNTSNALLMANHMWQGNPSTLDSGFAGNNILAESTVTDQFALSIVDNMFDGTYGNQIQINATAGRKYQNVLVNGNQFFQITGFPDNTFDVLNMGNAGQIYLVFTGNEARITPASTNYRAMVNNVGAGTVPIANVTNNLALNTNLLTLGFAITSGDVGNYHANDTFTISAFSPGKTQSPVFSATPTWNLQSGTILTPGTMTAAITAITFGQIPPAGVPVSITLTQNAGGPYNVTWPATAKFTVANPWINAAGASQTTTVNFTSDGTNLIANGSNVWY
jgi:hypothetical protein